MPYVNLQLFQPEIALCLVGLAVLILDLIVPRRESGRTVVVIAAIVGLLGCLKLAVDLWGNAPITEFHGSYAIDGLAIFLKAFFIITGILVVLLAADFFRKSQAFGEFFVLLVFLVLGMCLLAGANDLILIYLAFELVSLTSYLFAAWKKRDRKSNEAGIKYFIYGAAASGVMLYGLTLIYAVGGSTNLLVMSVSMMRPYPGAGLALVAVLGVVLMVVGLGYKISMVPFHAWAPDVYEGAPTPVTALLSVGPKAAGFAVLLRVFYVLGPSLHVPWQVVFAILAVLTMFTGNLLAIRQTNVKRMMAYSSIAHAGYMLIGFVVGPSELWGLPAILVYLVAYLLMNLGLFGVVVLLERNGGTAAIDDFAGLAKAAPGLALITVVFLLSLTGIPPTAGFLGKLYLFAAAIKSREWAWLAVIGIINSVISLYYYMNIARLMYFEKTEKQGIASAPRGVSAVIWFTAIATLVMFAVPDGLIDAARAVLLVR